MPGPGEYRADRPEGITRVEDLPRAKVVERVRFARMPVDHATVERMTRKGIDPAKFTVTPSDRLRRHAERFLRTASDAGVKTMSERRLTLAEYKHSITARLHRTLTPHDPVDASSRQPGVLADYYEADAWPRDRKLTHLKPVASMTQPWIDLAGRKRNQMFGFVFTGLFHAPRDGVYTFEMRAESGSELQVAGEVVIDSARVNSANAIAGMVALRQGWHPIRLRFIEYGYNDGLSLTWSGPGVNKSPVTAEQLGHLPQ